MIAELRAARLGREFFARDARTVARALIGAVLVHRRRAGVIVETEAYLGPEDRASHARFGPTARTAVMFGPGGFSYVYLCYGIHELFNIVTGAAGQGQAVLVRAIAPLAGLPDDPAVGRGPGRSPRRSPSIAATRAATSRAARRSSRRRPARPARRGSPPGRASASTTPARGPRATCATGGAITPPCRGQSPGASLGAAALDKRNRLREHGGEYLGGTDG